MTATPNVTTPSYSGIGSALASDVAPLIQSAHTFLGNIDAMVATTDGMSAPGGMVTSIQVPCPVAMGPVL